MNSKKEVRTPKFYQALILSISLILILLLSVLVFKLDIQRALFICLVICGHSGNCIYGNWRRTGN